MTTEQKTWVLQEILADDDVNFRIHNVKLSVLMVKQDLPQMFLAHYDRLDEPTKQQHPLNATLLKQLNTQMTANDACQLLGLPANSIQAAHHIKIKGSCVIACDELALALYLQFTNTAKPSQAVYGKDLPKLVEHEARLWQLAGNVHVLYKKSQALISQDLQGDELEIATNDSYIRLPNSHALATTHTINTLKDLKPGRLDFLDDAIVQKVMAEFQAQS